MKVCFPVESDHGFDSMMFNQLGPAPSFMVFDSESNRLTSFINDNHHSEQGECDPAKALNNQEVHAIVLNCIGSGALDKLNESGIKVFKAGATNLRENLAMFAAKYLPEYSAM